jgi:hypothetical protein
VAVEQKRSGWVYIPIRPRTIALMTAAFAPRIERVQLEGELGWKVTR